MTPVRDIEDRVREYVVTSYLTASEVASFGDDTDLLNLLDSLQILRLLMAMESAFGVKAADGDLTPDNLGSVRRLAAFLARKLAGNPTGASINASAS